MSQACHAESALKAEGLLTGLAREMDKTHPGAAASLRDGMAETLTITGAAAEVPRAWALEFSSGPGTLAAAGPGGFPAPLLADSASPRRRLAAWLYVIKFLAQSS